jgi:hypothetical protein
MASEAGVQPSNTTSSPESAPEHYSHSHTSAKQQAPGAAKQQHQSADNDSGDVVPVGAVEAALLQVLAARGIKCHAATQLVRGS